MSSDIKCSALCHIKLNVSHKGLNHIFKNKKQNNANHLQKWTDLSSLGNVKSTKITEQ